MTELNQKNQRSDKLWSVLPIILTLAISTLYFLLSVQFHYYFEEADGITQSFESKLILAGKGYSGWGSNYWPPLYTLMLTFFYLIFGDYFIAGKFISTYSIGGIAFFIWKLTDLILKRKRSLNDTNYFEEESKTNIGILFTFLFIITSSYFVYIGFLVENEGFSSFLVIASIYFFLRFEQTDETKKLYFFAIFSGLAIFTRYTNLFLAVLPILLIFKEDFLIYLKKNKIQLLFSYIILFIPLISYVIYSFLIKGEYINYQYYNIAREFHSENFLYYYNDYDSFFDVLQQPIQLIMAYGENLYDAFYWILKNVWFLIILFPAFAGIFVRFSKFNRTELYIFLIIIIYTLFRALGDLLNDYYVVLFALLIPFIYFFFQDLVKNLNILIRRVEKSSTFKKLKRSSIITKINQKKIMYGLLISIISVNSAYAYLRVYRYCFEFEEIANSDIINGGTFLKNYSPGDETIMGGGGYAYYSELNMVFLPDVPIVDDPNLGLWDIFKIDDFPEKIQRTQDYYFFTDDDDGYVDYLVLDKNAVSADFSPYFVQHYNDVEFYYENYKLTSIYRTDKCVIFEITLI